MLSEIELESFLLLSIAAQSIGFNHGLLMLCWLWQQGTILSQSTVNRYRLTLFFFRFFAEEDLTTLEKSVAIDMCMEFHTTTITLSDDFYLRLKRHNYVTPTSYLELIFTFKDLLRAKRT